MTTCNKCKSSNILIHDKSELQCKNGISFTVNILYSECGDCKREFITSNQIKINELRMTNYENDER